MNAEIVELTVDADADNKLVEWFNAQVNVYNWRWNEITGVQQWNLN
jgi:hypothetical protein